MSERAVEKHVGSVFQKLGLVHESDVNRRVMAVLAFLEATGGRRPVEPARAGNRTRSGGQPPVRRCPAGDDVGRGGARCPMSRPGRRRPGALPSRDGGRGRGDRRLRRGRRRRRRGRSRSRWPPAAPRPGADGRQPAGHRRHRGRPALAAGPRPRSWCCSRPTTRTSSTSPGRERRRTSPSPRSGPTGSQRPGPPAAADRGGVPSPGSVST